MSKKESIKVLLPLSDYNLMKKQNESWKDMAWRMNAIQTNSRRFRSDLIDKYKNNPIKIDLIMEFLDSILEI